jgi:hypothetical protein
VVPGQPHRKDGAEPWKRAEKLPLHRHIGHIAVREGRATSPDGK